MPLLDTRKQVAAKLEDVTGLAQTLVGADVDVLPIEAVMTPEFDTFDREFVRETLSRLLAVTTEELGAFTLTTELRGTQGGAFSDGAPSWFKFAQACGMQQVTIDVLALDVTSPLSTITDGPFRHGELITGGTSSATARVVHDWHNGTAIMYVRDVVGAFSTAETITGQDTSATATLKATGFFDDDYGFALFPVDEPEKTVNIDADFTSSDNVNVGDVIEGVDSGALGIYISSTASAMTFRPLEGAFNDSEALNNKTQGVLPTGVSTTGSAGETYTKGASMTIRLNEDGYYSEIAGARGNMRIVLPQVNRPGRVEFAFSGFWNDDGDAVFLTGTQVNLKQPPLFRNTSVYLGDNLTDQQEDEADEYNPCLGSLELDLGNQLVNRECQGALKGIQEVLISERQGAGRMDPELTLNAVFDWVGLLSAGTPVRLRTTIGTANGNKFFITAPGLQFESAAPGERNKIVQRDIGFKMTSGNINNLVTTPTTLSTIGGANELVITYITGPSA